MADKITDLIKAKEKGLTTFKYVKNKEAPDSSTLTVESKIFNPYTGVEEKKETVVYAKYQFTDVIVKCDKEIAEWTARKESALAMLEQFKEE